MKKISNQKSEMNKKSEQTKTRKNEFNNSLLGGVPICDGEGVFRFFLVILRK